MVVFMHPRNNKRVSDAIKSETEISLNPILLSINKTGYELDDISALTCIVKSRLWQLVYNDIQPTEHEISLLKMILPSYTND